MPRLLLALPKRLERLPKLPRRLPKPFLWVNQPSPPLGNGSVTPPGIAETISLPARGARSLGAQAK